MRLSIPEAITLTIAYADIFHFPLTQDEVRFWCIYRKLPSAISVRVPKRGSLLSLRKKRSQASRAKWEIARRVSALLKIFPTIELVGVTGALAMDNAGPDDDVDFLIITKPGVVWTTRLLVTIFLDILSFRRRPRDVAFINKICLNMFMSTDGLSIPKSERDVFTAHEVLQMKPLWDRGGVHHKFLEKNSWVKTFLPTAWREISGQYVGENSYKNSQSSLRWVEPIARAIQLWYMKKRRTTEVVTDRVIRFHPVDARAWIYLALRKRLKGFSVPLDKIFYGS